MTNEVARQAALLTYIEDNVGEVVQESHVFACQKINASYGPLLDFERLLE